MDERFAIRTYDESGNRITEFDESLGWFEWTEGEQNEYSEWVMTRVYHPYTEEELAEIERQKAEEAAAAEEAYKQSPEYRVAKMESLMNIFLGVSE